MPSHVFRTIVKELACALHGFCVGLRVFLQVCERCNKSRAISDGDLETRPSGSRVMRREVICEPVEHQYMATESFPVSLPCHHCR